MAPLLLMIASDQIGELLFRDDLYDDFCVMPARPEELVARYSTSSGARVRACARTSSSTGRSC